MEPFGENTKKTQTPYSQRLEELYRNDAKNGKHSATAREQEEVVSVAFCLSDEESRTRGKGFSSKTQKNKKQNKLTDF